VHVADLKKKRNVVYRSFSRLDYITILFHIFVTEEPSLDGVTETEHLGDEYWIGTFRY